ncbi:MAG: reverse transcriptase domain-containing protein, partial [Bacteroidota bacterium]
MNALSKKDSAGVRPIAVGDVLRRWVTRAVCLEHKQEWEKFFEPWQFAVGVSSGAEKLAASAKSYLEAGDDRGIVLFDARNGFNEAERQDQMDGLAEHFPWLLDFFWQWYGEPAELWYTLEDGTVETILSSQGTQQGDPAGPFLFSLGLQRHLAASASHEARPHVTAFMDDVQVAAPCTVLGTCAQHTMSCLQKYMPIAPAKSVAYSPSGTAMPNLPAGVRVATEGVKVVGVPIGEKSFLLSELQTKATTATATLRHLPKLEPQTAMLLLRHCIAPRIHFALRTIAPSLAPEGVDILRAYDDAILLSFLSIIGLGPSDSPPPRSKSSPPRSCRLRCPCSWAVSASRGRSCSG